MGLGYWALLLELKRLLPPCVAVRLFNLPSKVQFNIQQFYVLHRQCIYVFCVDLRTNSDYFPIQH